MSALSAGMSRPGEMILLLAALLLAACSTRAAPVYEHDTTHIAEYEGEPGCYYNFQRYEEGARIVTNEPCLNCTCHNRMLMCYLRVCPPFSKAIGQDCTVEKRPDQCCPVITCPEVPVQLLTSTTHSPSTVDSTEIGAHDNYGCHVEDKFYADGAQLPIDPRNPCELCYCIRNRTTCVMQECTLRVAGCNPVYVSGVCCPVKYDCDYDEDQTTTVSPTTPGLIMTTTVAPGLSAPQCFHQSKIYNDGELIDSPQACEHCYCFRGDIVCAVQDCAAPLKTHGKHCVPLPPPKGKCCPTAYQCDGESSPIEINAESTLNEDLPITGQYPDGEQTTQSLVPAPGYHQEDDSQQTEVVDAFPGADNVIPELHGSGEGSIEGTIEQETVHEDDLTSHTVKPVDESAFPVETSTEVPTDVKDTNLEEKPTKATGIDSKPEAEEKFPVLPEGLTPTKIALPEGPVTIDEEQPTTPAKEEEITQTPVHHDNEVQSPATIDESGSGEKIEPVVNVEEVKPTEIIPPAAGTVSSDEITGTEIIPTKEIVSEEIPKPTEVTSDVQESDEGSGDQQILEVPEIPTFGENQPTESAIEDEKPEEPISEDEKPVETPAIGEPQEPTEPVDENQHSSGHEGPVKEIASVTESDEIAVEKSTALPTEIAPIDEEATKEPTVLVTEAAPSKETKPEDSSILFPGEVALGGDTSTLSPTQQEEVPELPTEAVHAEDEATKEPELPVTETVPPKEGKPEDSSILFPGEVSQGGSDLGEGSASQDASTLKPTQEVNLPELPTEGEHAVEIPAGGADVIPESHEKNPEEEPVTGTIEPSTVPPAEEKPVTEHEHPTSEIPTSAEEHEKLPTEGTIISEEHPTGPVVGEEAQPEVPSDVEHPSKPAVHGDEHGAEPEIPAQGPTGIPMSDRVPVHKAEDSDAVTEMHITEVYDEVQHTHVPDSLIIDTQEKLPTTYIPPTESTPGSEIRPEHDVTKATEHDVLPHEEQSPISPITHDEIPPEADISTKIPIVKGTPSSEQIEHEKPIEAGQQPTEVTEKEPLEHGIDEQHNIDEQIVEEAPQPTISSLPVPESPEVSTEIHEAKPEDADVSITDVPTDIKPTESQQQSDDQQHHVPAEDEGFPVKPASESEETSSESPVSSHNVNKEEEQGTEGPIVSVELPAEHGAEEKPFEEPTHDEKVTEISTAEGKPTEASVVKGPSEGSVTEEKPTTSSRIEDEHTEAPAIEERPTEISAPVEEPSTSSTAEQKPIEPVIADEEPIEAPISQEHLTEGAILSEVPVEVDIAAEGKPTDGSLINEKPTEASIAQEPVTEGIVDEQKPIKSAAGAEEKPSDVLVPEERPTESSISQEELTQGSIIDHKPIDDSVTDEKPTDTSVPEEAPTQAPIDEQKINEPSSADEKPIDVIPAGEQPTEISVTDVEPTVTSVDEKKPTQISIAGETPTQAPVADDEISEHSNANQKPIDASDVEEKPTEASITEEKITSGSISEEKPTETSIAEHEPTLTAIAEEKPTETSIIGETPTQTLITSEESSEPSGTDKVPIESSIVEEKPTESSVAEKATDVPAVEEELSEGPITEQKETEIHTADEEPTEVSVTEEKTQDVTVSEEETPEVPTTPERTTDSSVTEAKPTEISAGQHEPTDGSIVEEKPTETSSAKYEPTDGSIAEGELINAPVTEGKPTDAVPIEKITEPETVNPTETTEEHNGLVEPSISVEKPEKSPIPTDVPTKTVLAGEEPTEATLSGEQPATVSEQQPTEISGTNNQVTDTLSLDKATEPSVTEEKPAEQFPVEEDTSVSSPEGEKPTEISPTDQKITDAPDAEEKPTDASVSIVTETGVSDEEPSGVSEDHQKPVEPTVTEEKPSAVPEDHENPAEPSITEEKPTEGSVTDEKLTEPSIADENLPEVPKFEEKPTETSLIEGEPTEGLVIHEKPTESSVVEDHPVETSDIGDKPAILSLPDEKPTEVTAFDDEATESSISQEEPSKPNELEQKPVEPSLAEEKPTEIPAGNEQATEPSVSKEKPSKPFENNETPVEATIVEGKPEEGPAIDDKLMESPIPEEKPTKSAVPEEGPTEASLPEEKPTVLSEIPVIEEKITESSVAEEKPTETLNAEEVPIETVTVKDESSKPTVHEDESTHNFVPEEIPSEPSVSHEKPTEPTIAQEIPTQSIEEVQFPVTPSTEEQQPIEPGKPVLPSEIPNEDKGEEQATTEHERPELFGGDFPPSIPGEGNCLVDGQSFPNNSAIPPANLCQLRCHCISSIVHCDLVECSPPPAHLSNCMPVHTNSDSCCPIYSCDSIPTAELESDSQMAEHHTPGFEGITQPTLITKGESPAHISPIDEHGEQPGTPSAEVTPASDLQSHVPIDNDASPNIETNDQKTVEPTKQEAGEPTIPEPVVPGSLDTNEIPKQPVAEIPEQNVKPEESTEIINPIEPQTEKVTPTEEQQPIIPEEQKPVSPIETSEEGSTAATPTEHAGETPAPIDEQSIVSVSPVTDVNVPLVSVDEHSTEAIITDNEHSVEPATIDQQEQTDIIDAQKPAVEVETETASPSLPANENDVPEEFVTSSGGSVDNETIRPNEEQATSVPVAVTQEEEEITDAAVPAGEDTSETVAPIGESITQQSIEPAQPSSTPVIEDHAEHTEGGKLPVVGDQEHTLASVEPTEISAEVDADKPIVKRPGNLAPSVEEQPEKHIPEQQPESDEQSTVSQEHIGEPSHPVDESDVQQEVETGEPIVSVDSSTVRTVPEVETPASTVGVEDHSESVAVPTEESALPDHGETSAPTLAGQEPSVAQEGFTVTPVRADEEAPASTPSTDNDATLVEQPTSGPAIQTDIKAPDSTSSTQQVPIDELSPTDTSAHDETPHISDVNALETTAAPDQQTSAPGGNEDVQTQEAAEPTIGATLPDSTAGSTLSEGIEEQTTGPISPETAATPGGEEQNIVPVAPVTAGPVSHDETEPVAPSVSNEDQVTEVKPTTGPVTPEHAESSEPAISSEYKPIEEERPTQPEEGIVVVVPEANAEEHGTPILNPTAGPVEAESTEPPAPTVSQEGESVAPENPTTGPVSIDSSETTAPTTNVEGQTVAHVEEPAGPVTPDHAELPQPTSSEASEHVVAEGSTTESTSAGEGIKIIEPAVHVEDHSVSNLEPSVRPTLPESAESPVPTVNEEGETVPVEQPGTGEIPHSVIETPEPVVNVEGQTIGGQELEPISHDYAVTTASPTEAEETTAAQQPAVEPSSHDGTEIPTSTAAADEQPIEEPHQEHVSPDQTETSAPAISGGESLIDQQPTIVPVLHNESESLAPTESIEKEATPTSHPEGEQVSDNEAEVPAITVSAEGESISVEGTITSGLVSNDQTKLATTSSTSEGQSDVTTPVSAAAESETPASTGPVVPEVNTGVVAPTVDSNQHTIEDVLPTSEPISIDHAETPAPTSNEEGQIIVVESSTAAPVSHDDSEAPVPTAGTPDDTITVEISTTGPIGTEHTDAPLTTPSEEGEIVAVEQPTVGPISHDDNTVVSAQTPVTPDQSITAEVPTAGPVSTHHAETPLPTPSKEDEIIAVNQPTVGPISHDDDTEVPAQTPLTPDQSITAEVPTAGTVSTHHAETPLPTQSNEGEIIAVEQHTVGPDSHEDEALAPTAGAPDQSVTVKVPTIGPISTDHAETSVPTSTEESQVIEIEQQTVESVSQHDDIEIPTPTAGAPDQSITAEAPSAGPVLTDNAETPLPTLTEEDQTIIIEQPTPGPVSHEDDSEVPAPIRGSSEETIAAEVPTTRPVPTEGSETPLPTHHKEDEIVAVQQQTDGSALHDDDDNEVPAPTAGSPEEAITANVPTDESVSSIDTQTALPTPSGEGEIIPGEQPTTGPVAHDDTKTSAPAESTEHEIPVVKESTTEPTSDEHAETPTPTPTPTPTVVEQEAVEAEHPIDESGVSDHAEEQGLDVKPLNDTLTTEDLTAKPPKQEPTSDLTPVEPTGHPDVEETLTGESIPDEAPTQSIVPESVKPDSETPITDETSEQDNLPVDVTAIEQKPEKQPITPELEQPTKAAEADLASTTVISEEPASEKPSDSEETHVEPTQPSLVEEEVTESGIKDITAEEEPVEAPHPVTESEKPVVSEQTEVPTKESVAGDHVTETSAPAELAPSPATEEQTDEDQQQHVQAPDQLGEVPEHPTTDDTEGQLTIGADDHPVSPIEHPVKDTKHPTRPGYYEHPITSTLAPQGSLAYPDQTVSGEDNSHFPINNGSYLTPEAEDNDANDDYDEDDQAIYGPGTCRYGGKVYVSAQQIPRDDPCDFCFCFRSDIICLQQSCPPPIPGCHEEPINGFCCPRYECPVSMATSLNLTTTTTTTTTTLPPHFLSHAYKGAARRSGCQIRGQAYRVGEVIPSSSGPCLQCTCGGDGNMKCEPRVCSPEPMLRQMIAAATAKRRR